jgi:glycosyltransferase involved in cell wall biosynthesis
MLTLDIDKHCYNSVLVIGESFVRIAVIASPYIPIPPKQYGGTEQVIHYLIKGLKESGHEPVLLAPGDSKADCELIPITPESIYFPSNQKLLPEHNRLKRQADARTNRLLKKLLPDIDVIHSHGFDLNRFSNEPNVTTIHGMIDFKDIQYYLRRKHLNFVSISLSQQMVLPDLIFAGNVYNGEDPDEFPIVTNPDKYLCFLGRFDRDKNPHLAIQLALNLGIKIKLAGKIDFRGREYFETEIKQYLDHPLVEYIGEVGFKDKVELLSNALCNLHPTNFREPFGLTVMEAAYCGTPTIATLRGSMNELIEPNRTGVLVEDFIEARQGVEKCIEMDREYIASRARQLFNHKNMTQGYLSVYDKVIEQAKNNQKNKGLVGKIVNRVFRNVAN